ncbi:MAG TPA: hypothetical protein VF407_17280 [Polyangiaceae bacterium]
MRLWLVVVALSVAALFTTALVACSADDASTTLDASTIPDAGFDCAPLPTDVTYACDPLDGGSDGAPICNGISSGTTSSQYPFGCTATTPRAIAGQDQNGCSSPLTCTCQIISGSEAGASFVCPN